MKKTLQILSAVTFAIAVLGLLACRSTEKLLEEGKYEQVIRLAKNKIRGDGNNKKRDVVALEEAFNRLQERDLERIERLRQNGDIEAWQKVYALSHDILDRQEALRPFLPVRDDTGYQAKFNFIKVDEFIEESMGKASRLLYSKALDEITLAREGNKEAARNAYQTLRDLERYQSDYKDMQRLMSEAESLGLVRVWVEVSNESATFTPPFFEEELLSVNFSRLNDRWTQYYIEPQEDTGLDYKVELEVHHIQVGRDVISEREIVRQREVEDGWQYVLDENGNVAKDSLGNDIKEPKWVNVKGTVLQSSQVKEASIRGRLKLIDLHQSAVIESRPMRANAVFEHVAQRYFGDSRALDEEDLRVVPPAPFPNDGEMIMLVAESLREEFYRALRSLRI